MDSFSLSVINYLTRFYEKRSLTSVESMQFPQQSTGEKNYEKRDRATRKISMKRIVKRKR